VGPARAAGPGVQALAGPLPFPFEQNVGQADRRADFLLRLGPLQAACGAGGPTYRLAERAGDKPPPYGGRAVPYSCSRA
jgi:hypothetical protein